MNWLERMVNWIFARRLPTRLTLEPPAATRGRRRLRYRRDPPPAPHDPHSFVRAPRRRGPTDRSASVAVAEPIDDEHVVAIGARNGGGEVVRRTRKRAVNRQTGTTAGNTERRQHTNRTT